MKDYAYIGVMVEMAEFEEKFVVRSKCHSIHEGDLVAITIGRNTIMGEVLHAAFLPIGSEEEAMLAEFGNIYDVDKIYNIAWKKKEEETDGN